MLLCVTGCQADSVPDAAGSSPSGALTPAPPPPTTPSPSPAPTAEPTESPDRSPTDAPKPGSLDEPATSSGPLGRSEFPRPRQVGSGWSFAIDPGDAEEGYAGNGTPTLARDPREVALAAVPFGCRRADRLPAPRNALEVDYEVRDSRVIVLGTAFGSPGTARAFFDARRRAIRGCAEADGGPAVGPLVGATRTRTVVGTVYFASERTPSSQPFTEHAFLAGDRVVLIAVPGLLDPGTLTRTEVRRLATFFGDRP